MRHDPHRHRRLHEIFAGKSAGEMRGLFVDHVRRQLIDSRQVLLAADEGHVLLRHLRGVSTLAVEPVDGTPLWRINLRRP